MKKYLLSLLLMPLAALAQAGDTCPDHLNGEYRKLHSSSTVDLCELLNNKPALVVNTASHCGFTKQFEGLEAVHQKYKDQGLVVVGFASDAFKQEANSEEEAATICFTNYGVSFTMLAPTEVTGESANALFAWLAEQTEEPSWNFNKYVIDPSAGGVEHFGSTAKPGSESLTQAIEAAL
ncbi:glutathione peroxidase [Gilvimarinus sp. SDUM040013]|uniref:Glutathione peroxidase n=1 Tax=Gilvimarinus gilvus TaxID=3058038 RepID=A0ABU4RZ43_9GAMM|nr:glutathione peroxidase [Gilvimarinus sp. SDUM040013]MDO3387579.1 glutathione peroxidase [Gilvimarinus sp. SDUM040013]MDX6850156.1 glutathione peroxidase [Gilvimarinus sp. SDUM040013]